MNLFGGGGSQSNTPTRLSAIQISRSAYGDCIPLLYGRNRITGTLLWYGDFTATEHASPSSSGGKGGGGSGGSTSYTYSAALVIGLCEAPLASVNTVYADKTQTDTPTLNFVLKSGLDGIPWSYLTTNHPNQAVPFDHTATLCSPSFQLGSSAAMPNMTYEATGIGQIGGAYSILDADVALMLLDYFSDPNHGANFTYLDASTYGTGNSLREYCGSMGFFLSPYENTQRPASDFATEICEIVNSAPFWSVNSLKIIPYCDEAVSGSGYSYTPNLTPEFDFTDEDFQDMGTGQPVQHTRKDPTQRWNKIRVEYLNRANQYNTDIAEASDQDDIERTGERLMQTLSYHEITTAACARQVAQLRLQRELYVVNTYTFKVLQNFTGLEPMDLVTLTDSVLGLNRQLVRITEVTEDENDQLTITAEEVPIGNANAPVYNWDGAAGYYANYGIDPGSVSAPLMFSAPPLLVSTTAGGYQLWIAVAGTGSAWGGATIWASFDGTTYKKVGVVRGSARYGTLHSNLADSTDPDTTNTLTVDLLSSRMALLPGTTADADNARSLIFVDGEIMSYRDCNLVATNRYAMGYLRRALYGSSHAAHAAGSNFARLDDRIFKLDFDNGDLGTTIHLKFTSFNIYGGAEQSLADVTDYTRTLAAATVSLGSGADGQSVYIQFGPTTSFSASHTPPYVAGTDLYMFIKVGSGAWSSAILISGAGPTGPAGPAIWTPVLSSNMAQTGGASFTKVGSSNAWDAQVYSAQVYPACFVTFTVPSNTKDVAVGLSVSPTADASYASINYAWSPSDAGTATIYESGNPVVTGVTYAANDVFAITYDGFIVRYLHNGTLVRAVPVALKQFYLDSSFYQGSSGASVNNLAFGVLAQSPLSEGGPGNFLHTAQWTVGTSGSQGNYADQTSGTAGSIVQGDGTTYPLGPYGYPEPLWKGNYLTASGANGGFINNGDIKGFDSTKVYRYAVWFCHTGTASADFYLGPDAGSVVNVDGSANSNPYCVQVSSGSLTPGKWYLAVGYIYGSAYSFVSQNLSGIYDPKTGAKITSTNEDYKWAANVAAAEMRAYSYYGNTSGYVPYFARPRFEEITGSEPSVATLLSPGGILAYLDTADTNQLALNAATGTYFNASTYVSNTIAAGAWVDYSLVSIPDVSDPTEATTAIVTVNIVGIYATNGSDGDLHICPSISSNANGVVRGQVVSITGSPQMMTLHAEFTYPASGGGLAAGVSIFNSAGTSRNYTQKVDGLSNGIFAQVEVIKR